MRRPPSACHRAVHSLTATPLQHIWISDDLLSLAITRFFHPTRSHQKRHGSNVPGPLEARRRAAKRKMTAQAAFQPSDGLAPPLFNWGALFGSRERGEPSWKYEPPSLNRTPPLRLTFDNVPPLSPTHQFCQPPTSITNRTVAVPDHLVSSVDDRVNAFPVAAHAMHLPNSDPTPHEAVSTVSNACIADFNFSQTANGTHRDPAADSDKRAPSGLQAQSQSESAALSGSDEREHRAITSKKCFEDFKGQISPAIALPENDRYRLLLSAIRKCHPAVDDKGHFSVLVLRHLLNERWMAGHIALSLSKSFVRLPEIHTIEGVELLVTLKTMAPPGLGQIRGIGQIYAKLAESARHTPVSQCRSEDDNLHLLMRGLWETSRSNGELLAGSVVELLLELGGKLSNKHLLRYLHPILRDTENAFQQVIFMLTACTRRPELMQSCLDLLNLIPRTLVGAWIASFPVFLFKSKGTGSAFKSNHNALERFEIWIKLMHKLDSISHVPRAASFSDLAFRTQARLFMDRDSLVIPPHSLVVALLYKLAGHTSLARVPTEQLYAFMKSYAPSLMKQHAIALSFNEMLARLILALDEASLPNHGVIDLMVPFINQYKGTLNVADLLKRVQTHGSTLSSTASLHELVSRTLDQIEVNEDHARTDRERQHNAYALHCCQKLRKLTMSLAARVHRVDAHGDLAAKALTARRQFHHIMDRARDARIVPLAYRHVPVNLPSYQKAEVIHQFAHQYSILRTRSHRQNWRSIYYLYKYLVLHNLTMSPMFTKAVVRACITQPLSENHFVSSRRLIWVCRLIARVEGEDVARRIEQVFWVWRGELILHAKKTLLAMGSHERAHVSTMKRLGLI